MNLLANMKKQRITQMMETAKDFIARGTAIIFLNPKSMDSLGLAPVTDLEAAEDCCNHNPYANIAVSMGQEQNLIALVVEPDTDYDRSQKEMLDEYQQLLGRLPDSMIVGYPDGTKNYLFECPTGRQVVRSRIDGTLRIMHGGMYSSGMVLLEPSVLSEGEVATVSDTSRIAPLPLKWQEYLCSQNYDPTEENEVTDEHVMMTAAVEEPSEEELQEHEEISAVYFEPEIAVVKNISTEVADSVSEEVTITGHNVSPEDYLDFCFGKSVQENVHPAETVANAMVFREKFNLPEQPNKLVYRIFQEYFRATAGRYSSVGEDEALIRFIGDVYLEIFRDDNREIRCRIKATGEIVSLSSNMKSGNKVYDYLTHQHLALTNSVPNSRALKAALRILEVNARFGIEERKLFNRVGTCVGDIYYDMGDNTAVRVTGTGWEIVTAPAIFKRHSNHSIQVKPVPEGKLERFFEFVNYDEKEKLLLSVYLVSMFIPEIPHPLLYVYGDHGSAKSSLTSKIKMLCDPSPTGCDRLTLPNKGPEVVRNLSQYHVVLYDNISGITDEISNLFCMASSGGGSDIRKLYTDGDSNVMAFKNCVILNSLKMCIVRPDLMDRSLLLRLARLKKHGKDSLINAEYSAALPEILGGMFDVLSKAIALYPKVQAITDFRMADFATWGYAIAEALSGSGKQFLLDYQQNRKNQNGFVAAGNTLCNAVLTMMNDKVQHVTDSQGTFRPQ